MAKIDPKNHARVAIRTQYISPKCYAQSYSLQVLQILRYMIQVVNCLYHLLSNLPKTLQLHVRINALTFLFIYVFRNSDFCILENSLRIFFKIIYLFGTVVLSSFSTFFDILNSHSCRRKYGDYFQRIKKQIFIQFPT